ncbi:MAG: hypothetical protein ACK5Q6_12305 [Cyanobacteriota bacterium]
MSDLKRIPISRAYWELKAEQMMNRVFDPDQTIDLQVDPEVAPRAHRPPAGGSTPWTGRGQLSLTAQATAKDPPQEAVPPPPHHSPSGPPPTPWPWLVALAGMGLVSTIAALLFVQQWTHLQRSLSQERNLLMVERLRSLGPANPEPMPTQVQVLTTPAAPSLEAIPRGQPLVTPGAQIAESVAPPPPPEEPWMQQLSELPSAAPATAPLLKVPLSPKLARAIPATSSASPGPIPQLVGLVAAPGKPGSAIFQIGATSTSVNVGETIGGTGWRLRSTDAESALVEREGVARRLAIVGGG